MNTFHNTRISILKDDIIRFEYSPSGHFSNKETLFIGKKKELFGAVNISNGEFVYQDLRIVFDENDPLNTIEIYQGDKRVYRYKFVPNSGELPLPNKTPFIFPVMDTPRLFIPEEGYDEESEYIYEKDSKDLFLLISRNDYKLLRKQYISLTGTNDMPRRNAFGMFHSRYYPHSDKSVKEMVERYKKNHIPLDNFVLDTDWRDFSKKVGVGYEINKKLFPDLTSLYHYLHKRGIEVLMNDHPQHQSYKLNVLSPEERKYRKENLLKFFYMGLDSWWYDRNWIVHLKSISKRIPVESLGRYIYHDITKNFYQGLVLDPEVYTRPVTLSNVTEITNGEYVSIKDSRSHTYPIQWTGDIPSYAGVITNEIINMNKCSNNMIAYYSSDIGGHTGNPTKQEFVRWYQYGCFSPILRPHATCSVKRFREPWVYGEKTLNTIKEYIYMRYRLLNVIYTNAYKHVYEGLGIFRPLYLNYPNDKQAYKNNATYMLGDNILISPIGKEKHKQVPQSSYVGPVYASFYDGENLKGKALVSKRLKEVNFYINGNRLFEEVPEYHFSARFTTSLRFDKNVDLYIANDDGVRVYINGKKVVDDWNAHAEQLTHVISMKKGLTYKVKIEYFQAGGSASLGLYYIPNINKGKCKTYLPEGEWYNLSHRGVYQGHRYIKEKYLLEDMPLFVKAGSLLPLYRYVDNIANMSLKNIIYDYYPSRKVVTEDYLYEDDGLTTGYKVDVNRKSPYRCEFKDDHYEVTLYKSENHLDDGVEARNVLFKMHVRDAEKVTMVLINDEKVRIKRHDHNKKVYPFSNTEWARDSKTCCFKFRQELKKNYVIKIYVEK